MDKDIEGRNNKLNLKCFNCRGLRDKTKRLSVLIWLRQNYQGISFLKETHTDVSTESQWKKRF